ncbi:hypothetical protein G9F72_018905 [Clostridium estertheticum]|uniref:hypothetical protein n=1 Tax=Clostridium estertheticum TaxID=238834 RepID=UPI0013E906C7|nr:hypothetical protein [Clostridium estertheticum]MBZ9688403.1 hypothetical protein [Clostridium estertheticum]
MKKVKIIMANGNEYFCNNLSLEDVTKIVTNEYGIFKDRSVLITGEDMNNRILINPKQVSSIEEHD